MAQNPVTQASFIQRYRESFTVAAGEDTHIDRVRFVVLDSETTGFNPQLDHIISIGAVAVEKGDIVLADSFEALLKVTQNTEAVTVHGITRDESKKGRDEAEVLEAFLDYLTNGVIVGHHIGHDIAAFDAAYERHWGFRTLNRAVDTMSLALQLEGAGAFAQYPRVREFTLDALCEMFGVIPHDRHTASGDAMITAHVFLRLRRLALKHGLDRLGQISEPAQ
jgi:DNA polymerase III subunit epsilon